MSVESTTTKIIYQGNGTTNTWPVPFAYNQTEHLHLLIADADGKETEIAENFSVVVSGSGDTSIIYPVSGRPLASGNKLVVYRSTPQTQIVDLEYGGAFSPETLEHDGLDRIVMMVQENNEKLGRALTLPASSTDSPEELVQALYDSRDEAAASAQAAAASAEAAEGSAAAAAASAVDASNYVGLAYSERQAACQCATRAEEARDVALQQVATANALMETELAKINLIVGADKESQDAAVEKANKWANELPNVPVATDESGNPLYSARHWAAVATAQAYALGAECFISYVYTPKAEDGKITLRFVDDLHHMTLDAPPNPIINVVSRIRVQHQIMEITKNDITIQFYDADNKPGLVSMLAPQVGAVSAGAGIEVGAVMYDADRDVSLRIGLPIPMNTQPENTQTEGE